MGDQDGGGVRGEWGRRPGRSLFWSCAVAGWAVIALGVVGLLGESSRTHPDQWVRWFLGALIVHDAVVAPIAIAVGALVVARIPSSWRGAVQGALFAAAVIVLTSWPLLRGYGRSSDNPSALPNNYARGLLIVLSLLLFATVATRWVGARGRRGEGA